MEKEQQELVFKLSIFEQQIQQLQQQLQAVEKGVVELSSLNFALDELKGSVGKEILATIGGGLFVNAKVLSENLIVDIGDKTFVKKSVVETKELIVKQIKRLEKAKKELEKSIEDINSEFMKLIGQAQLEQGHIHGPDCEHEH